MKTLTSCLQGAWVSGQGHAQTLCNPTTEEAIASASTHGLDFKKALSYGRDVGGKALRALSFAERGTMLKKLADAISAQREELLLLGMQNGGNTRSDAKFDVDGAIATLAYYAELCQSLGNARFLSDGDAVPLGRSPRLFGQHFLFPRKGIAIHINAYNFPAWGLAEKAATCLAAGMPFLCKPATSTALLAHRMFEVMLSSGALPDGAGQFVCGSVSDLLDHVESADVVAFTGSCETAALLRAHQQIIEKGVPLNVEADSLNIAVGGHDLERGTETYDLFLKNVVKEITQKTGQKCTAIRRIFVKRDKLSEVVEDLLERLSQHKVGAPDLPDVTIGPLATAQQKRDVETGIAKLAKEARIVLGGVGRLSLHQTDPEKGYFVMPTLLVAHDPSVLKEVHSLEVFGPVATVIPYENTEHLFAQAERGQGSLVASVFSDDRAFLSESVMGLSASHGRICLGSEKVAGPFIPPGTVMPQLTHGGPGRAGGGTELGGLRGMLFYMQRTAVSGFQPFLESFSATAKRAW